MPGTVNPGVNSRGQLGHPLHGIRGYSSVQSYGMPGHHLVQSGGLISRATTATIPAIQAQYPSGILLFLFRKTFYSPLVYKEKELHLMYSSTSISPISISKFFLFSTSI